MSNRPESTDLARARFALGAAVARAVRESMDVIAMELDAAADRCVEQSRRAALQVLAAHVSEGAFDRAMGAGESLALAALRSRLSRTERDAQPPRNRAESDLEDRFLVGALAASIRHGFGAGYGFYARRVRLAVGGRWASDDLNPLGAHAVAYAALRALAGPVTPTGTHRELCFAMCRRLAQPLALALAAADSVLRDGMPPEMALGRNGQAPGFTERRNLATRPGPVLERLVGERISDMISERLAQCEVPAIVREFLLDAWLRHLRTTALRDGEQSERFRASMAVVGVLVRSIDAASGRDGNAETPVEHGQDLAAQLSPLVRAMTEGVRAIGASVEQFQPFFDELSSLHGVLPRARSDVFDSAESPLAGGRARHEWPSGGAEPVLPSETPMFDLYATLASTDFSVPLQRSELPPERAWAALSAGSWIELVDSSGEVDTYRILWLNRQRSIAMLVRRTDRIMLLFNAQGLDQRFHHQTAFLMGVQA